MILLKLLHLFAVVIWVGGMFFAYMVLRPAAVEILQPPERLRLWACVFRRFFVWVWGAVVALPVSGLGMIYLYGGMAHVAHSVHIMLLLGLLMIGIYGHVYFAGYIRLRQHVNQSRWKEAGEMLGRMRKLIALNLLLGLLTISVAVLGAMFA